MKKVLFLMLMSCIGISVCAQANRKMQSKDDGTVWYQTVENNKYGAEIQGKQILPNRYEYISYAGKAYGLYYFKALVLRGNSFFDDACSLFNSKGEEVISYKEGYHNITVVYNKDGYFLLGVGKGHNAGIIDGRTGKVVVPLRNDYNWFPKFDSSRRKFYTYADDNKTQRIDVPFYAENMTKISTSSSSSALASGSSSRHSQTNPFPLKTNCSYKIVGSYTGDGERLHQQNVLKDAKIEVYSNDIVVNDGMEMRYSNLSEPIAGPDGWIGMMVVEKEGFVFPDKSQIWIKKINTTQYKMVLGWNPLLDNKCPYYIIKGTQEPIRNPKY